MVKDGGLGFPPFIVLGQLDRPEHAEPQIALLITLKPDFEEKAVFLISCYVKEAELVIHLLDGLKQAGVKFNAS